MSSPPVPQIHAISKADNTTHTLLSLPSPSPPNSPLRPSSIRIKTCRIALTSNNISYARSGTAFHWWTAFPTPPSLPSHPPSAWGILPAWGLARVLESTTPSLPLGSTLWGFLPTSEGTWDLHLAPAGLDGHFVEISTHRQRIWAMYNRYIRLPDSDFSVERFDGATVAAKPLWEAGWLLANYVLAPGGLGVQREPVHPFGGMAGRMGVRAWTREDADLSGAAVVVLGAAGRTGRAFVWNLLRNRPGLGVKALAVLASSKDEIVGYRRRVEKVVLEQMGYDALGDGGVERFVERVGVEKVVVVDCGGPVELLKGFVEGLRADVKKGWKVSVIGVGAEQKAHSEEEQGELRRVNEGLGKVGFNTTWVRDAVMEREGEKKYFEGVDETFWRFRDDGGMGEQVVVQRRGAEGVYQGWEDLVGKKLSGNQVTVVDF